MLYMLYAFKNIMDALERIKDKTEKLVIGLMSGTSQDGIDAALLKIKGSGKDTSFEVLSFETYDYDKEMKAKLHEATTKELVSLNDITRLNFAVGKAFAKAAIRLCGKANISINQVDLIGSHGQTIAHLPKDLEFCGETVRATMQIGEPSIISKETGCVTVADFRPCHIALGGEGAPLTSYTDYIIFSSKGKSRAVVNIGGITNITALPKNCGIEQVKAYDLGPGNMCIDEAMRILYKKEYDKDGMVAKRGKVNLVLLNLMLKNKFFQSRLRSSGNFDFGRAFIESILKEAKKKNISSEDVISTFTELTASLIAKTLIQEKVEEAVLCGGGYNNPELRQRITSQSKDVKFKDIKDFGMTADNREAAAFAILANETVSGSQNSLTVKRGFLGKIVLP
ncbi:anhydro-N-acetylmuramic acid kinase [Candidatus Woesearchaeota archaeon]|nr:anhydro-N-acetylmuramic acid kinase [Candidatus Woesearchaeota archaeon]